jgi:hypothetical protein
MQAPETAADIRHDGSGDAICLNPLCGYAFKPKKRTQRFCGDRCKAEFHDPDNRRIRGVVKGNRSIKGGHSITLHVADGTDVSRFQLGAVAEIL